MRVRGHAVPGIVAGRVSWLCYAQAAAVLAGMELQPLQPLQRMYTMLREQSDEQYALASEHMLARLAPPLAPHPLPPLPPHVLLVHAGCSLPPRPLPALPLCLRSLPALPLCLLALCSRVLVETVLSLPIPPREHKAGKGAPARTGVIFTLPLPFDIPRGICHAARSRA